MMGINRNKVRSPKKGRAWCRSCDACKVSDGQKCPNCGKRHGVSREKYKKRCLLNIEDFDLTEHRKPLE